jgi:gamma-glutamyltranspeptidase / glutathione hydrolase
LNRIQNHRKALIWAFLIPYILFACSSPEKSEDPNIGLLAENGMVVTAHPLASEVGVEILKKGGNAVDAAIAVQFALAVVFPAAGNISGGGFAVYRSASGEYSSLDFREKAPLLAHRNMYLDANGDVIDNLSVNGHLASGVPGSVDGMVKLYERYGSLPWADLVQPAIDLAINGFALTEREARGLNGNMDSFVKFSSISPDFLLKDGGWNEGDIIKWEDLGRTLEAIRDFGREGFYAGWVADTLIAEMERGGGIISHEDLKAYQSVWREPIAFNYKNYRIISMAPPSSGGVGIQMLFKTIEPFPIAEWGWNTPKTVHLISEAERRYYADRSEHLGDPDFWNVPLAELLSDAYIRSRFQDFDPNAATPSEKIAPGNPILNESEETTHFSIIDAFGNAVSLTTTLNGSYGSKVIVGGGGYLLNNEMDDLSIKPGVPNIYGLIGGEANAIEPGKRMLSSMTPTIVEQDGKLLMVVGTPGGSTIITSVFQTILNVIEFGMGMQEAVTAKRFHHQWLPDAIQIERNTFDSLSIVELEKLGHKITNRGAIGRVDAIFVRKDGKLEGGADPRGDDAARGY